MPRGIVAVYAMARPGRPMLEREALLAAAGEKGSARQRSARVAALVTAYLEREEASDPGEMKAIARQAALTLAPTPIAMLAAHPDVDAAALIRAERLARFEARACRQLDTSGWERETREILTHVRGALERRYARLLREILCSQTVFSSTATPHHGQEMETARCAKA